MNLMVAQNRWFPWCVVCAVLVGGLAVVGCGKSQDVRYAPAAGTVTLNGKPLDRAQIVLSCEEVTTPGPRPSSRGVSDAAGHFELNSLSPDKQVVAGAVVGRHHVTITTRLTEEDAQGNTKVVRPELLGPEYTHGEKVTIDVPAVGIEELRFDITSK